MSAELRRDRDVNGVIVVVDSAVLPHFACNKYGLVFGYERHVNRNEINIIL